MRSFFWRVFLAQLLGLAVALGTISFLLATTVKDVYTSVARRELQDRANAVAVGVALFLARHPSQEELRDFITLIDKTTAAQVCLLPAEEDGTEVLSSRRGSGGKRPAAQLQPELPGDPQAQILPGEHNDCGEDMLVARSHVPGTQEVVRLSASVAGAVSGAVAQVRRWIAYEGTVAILLSLLTAFLISRRVAEPVRRTTALAQRMAEGDFSQRLGIKGGDEFAALARSFDSLADSLTASLGNLHQEQARLRGILSSVAEGIVAVDDAGQILLINPQAAALLGLRESTGALIGELGLPEQVVQGFTQCLQEHRAHSLEFEYGRPPRFLVLSITPVRGTEEGRQGAVAVVRDETEPRRLEQMRRSFISDASHEIRTPLTSIGGFASAIMDGTASTPEEQARCASIIARESDRLSRLVNDLLDLSRIESGAVARSPDEVDLADLIRSAVEGFETQTHEQGVTVELNLPSDLPPVQADGDRLYQVLVNLVSNALRFNRERGRITVSAERQDGVVRVAVRDTGRGIDPAELPYIWERFYRADSSRARNDGGTGLGLAIVRSIVEKHGGTVSAESEVGEGSTFSFTLPVS